MRRAAAASQNRFVEAIRASDPEMRNRPFSELCRGLAPEELLAACDELEEFRRRSDNLYERVRACLFLYAAYRFQLMESGHFNRTGTLPWRGYLDLLDRRFEEAVAVFRAGMAQDGPNSAIFSALAEAYHRMAFQTLSDQVRRSVRASLGNRWMFRVGHPEDHPLRLRPQLFNREGDGSLFPILRETTPVRMDLSHSGWSDIFFLGMDYPEGARVLNISVDLGVFGRDEHVRPPVEAYLRVIPEPLLRLTSVDLGATKDITDLSDLFNFGNDYLSLLKAGIIASGLVPPSFEGSGQSLAAILARVGEPGTGIELVTKVNDIPKGSRLAVSTNLLAGIIAVVMRATGQTETLEGGLTEQERRLAASRAILGEWLGGSGGGWQDSGGVWPGLKIIEGARAKEGDPEYGVSRGCLLPQHTALGEGQLHPDITRRMADSLILFHGGMAQNVGPILEMVTEKYLLRAKKEWDAREQMRTYFDGIVDGLREGDVQAVAANAMANWQQPLKAIIPWVTNHYTETVIARAKEALGRDFWGFQMLGGMSGGGMGVYVAPERREAFRTQLLDILAATKAEWQDALPFAMDPVVYNFEINGRGTWAEFIRSADALMPPRYYALQIPELVAQRAEDLPYTRRGELDQFAAQPRDAEESSALLQTMVRNLFQVSDRAGRPERAEWDREADRIKRENGFDPVLHEQIRHDLRTGRIGLAFNRLPVETEIEDVAESDVVQIDGNPEKAARTLGEKALANGKAAVLSLAGGVGSRWTTGAGVIKAVNPFIEMAGKHRSFLELHLAKNRCISDDWGRPFPHVVSTSFLTHEPIQHHLRISGNYGFDGPLYLSRGRSIGQRFIPMVRDLVFLWEESAQEVLDDQKQKVREAVRGALLAWARSKGEGADYVDNVPIQRFHPPGHWYELPNLLRNGVLSRLLREHPQVETVMLHNVDTLGAALDPEPLGQHLASGAMLSFEVTPRRLGDRGGGLARVNGRLRLLEGLAQPRESDEADLRYYNSMTTWVQIDPMLKLFGLTRGDLDRPEEELTEAVRRVARRMPTYITIKDVKRRWGHGQEDVFPVCQFEKLWSDMSALSDCPTSYLAVSRQRGQQLKDPSELDPWLNDGSKDFVESLCRFD